MALPQLLSTTTMLCLVFLALLASMSVAGNDISAWTCPDDVDYSLSTDNVLLNSQFEIETTDGGVSVPRTAARWNGSSAAPFDTNALTAHSGTQSATTYFPFATDFTYSNFGDNLLLIPGEQYRFSFWLRRDGFPFGGLFGVYLNQQLVSQQILDDIPLGVYKQYCMPTALSRQIMDAAGDVLSFRLDSGALPISMWVFGSCAERRRVPIAIALFRSLLMQNFRFFP